MKSQLKFAWGAFVFWVLFAALYVVLSEKSLFHVAGYFSLVGQAGLDALVLEGR